MTHAGARNSRGEPDPGAFYDRLIWALTVTGAIAGVAYAVGISGERDSQDFTAALVLGEASILAATAFTVAPLHFFRYMSRRTAHITAVLRHIAGPEAPDEPWFFQGSLYKTEVVNPDEVSGVDDDGNGVRLRLLHANVSVRWMNPDGSPSKRFAAERVQDLLDVQFAEERAALTLVTNRNALTIIGDDPKTIEAMADKIVGLRDTGR